MISRRSILKAAVLVPPALAWGHACGLAAGAGRIALVIGNQAYPQVPLANPVNDAQAMGALLGQAGFDVSLVLNTGQAAMRAALDRFAQSVRHPGTQQALFYYAGHGAQVDWKNYLVPVDVPIRSTADLRERCADLTQLLGSLAAIQGKTFIFILDACREDPFGTAFRTELPGLSQLDAPVGSLLAYATAPGHVAADGSGEHGLYTGHLLAELSVRGARIEDALKRVRLNVRLASQGAQIPWESTSLETDIVIFPAPGGQRSAAELETQFEEELAVWQRIQASRDAADWIAYLRRFPNGRFSEIAQIRLGRLLPPGGLPSPADGKRAPDTAFEPNTNPYSAGTYPLQRRYTVGDEAAYRESDLLTGVVQRRFRMRVTRVDVDADRVELNGGRILLDSMGNPVSNARSRFDIPVQLYPAQLQAGAKWTAASHGEDERGRAFEIFYDLHIRGMERVTVPAGEFHAFRIEGRGWNLTKGVQLEITLWVVPGINFYIKRERTHRRNGRLKLTERHELSFLAQQGHKSYGVRD